MSLAEYLTENLQTPFSWRSHDCCTFVNRWITHATGRDHLAAFPPWSNAREAMRIAKREGGLETAMDARFRRIEPNFARDGDIALAERCLCLFSGSHVVAPGPDGLAHVDRTRASAAWSLTG